MARPGLDELFANVIDKATRGERIHEAGGCTLHAERSGRACGVAVLDRQRDREAAGREENPKNEGLTPIFVGAPYVIVDDKRGARLAMEHLIELGHKKIGFIGGPADVQSSQDRMTAYREVLAEHRFPYREGWACFSDFTQAAGQEAARRILSLVNRPTAIFAANDVIALGVMEAAEELGLEIPKNLSLVGYDDIAYASLPRVQLTTIAQPIFEMGRSAAEYLPSVIEEGRRRKLRRVVEPQLVVRRATFPPE